MLHMPGNPCLQLTMYATGQVAARTIFILLPQALVAITATRTNMPSSEAELSPIDKLISEAYSEIDKAIVKVQCSAPSCASICILII